MVRRDRLRCCVTLLRSCGICCTDGIRGNSRTRTEEQVKISGLLVGHRCSVGRVVTDKARSLSLDTRIFARC